MRRPITDTFVKLGDPRLNRSREIGLQVIVDGIFSAMYPDPN